MATDSEPSGEKQTECKLAVYMAESLRDELDRHCVNTGSDEEESRSKVIRRALREYFRRHPIR